MSSEDGERKRRLLDEASHRKVEGAFDELRRAARNIDRSASEISEAGGEERLSALLQSASAEIRALVDRLMSEAYFRPPSDQEKQALAKWKESLPKRAPATDPTDGQESLFGEDGDEDVAA